MSHNLKRKQMERKRAKVHMLPTEHESKIRLDNHGVLSFEPHIKGLHYNGLNHEYIHLYFTTDEEIKGGDWIYNELTHFITWCKKPELKREGDRKIIATTDPKLKIGGVKRDGEVDDVGLPTYIPKTLPQPSKAFIEKFCKVGDIDEVDVEYETGVDRAIARNISLDALNPERVQYFLKVDPINNTITIHPIKSTWSEKEVRDIAFKAYITPFCNTDGKIEPDMLDVLIKRFDKWFDKHLQK